MQKKIVAMILLGYGFTVVGKNPAPAYANAMMQKILSYKSSSQHVQQELVAKHNKFFETLRGKTDTLTVLDQNFRKDTLPRYLQVLCYILPTTFCYKLLTSSK